MGCRWPRTGLAGARRWCSMSDLVRIDETLWEIPAEERPGHARSGARLRGRRAPRRDPAGPLARAARERRDAPRHRRSRPGDAGHPPGVRLPGRGGRRDRGAGRDRVARRRRLRHQLRRPPARASAHRDGARTGAGRPSCTSSRARSRPGSGKPRTAARSRGPSSTACCARVHARSSSEGSEPATTSSARSLAAAFAGADPAAVSERARERGAGQLGTRRLREPLHRGAARRAHRSTTRSPPRPAA